MLKSNVSSASLVDSTHYGAHLQYEGKRFRAECHLAGKLYGRPFGVDVAFGDPNLGEPDTLVAEDVLSFAGITPPSMQSGCVKRWSRPSRTATRIPSLCSCPSRYRLVRSIRGDGARGRPRLANARCGYQSRTFLDPVLAGDLDAHWEPASFRWRPR